MEKLDLCDPDLQKKLDAIVASNLAQSPRHIKQLGRILRRKSIFSLHRFMVEHGMAGKIPKEDLPIFMDYLITQRIDLKDMHVEARKRLRDRALACQPEELKTDDYKKHVDELGEDVRCRDCQWFMKSPPWGEKSCVQMGGAKGIDAPCFGFTKKKMQ